MTNYKIANTPQLPAQRKHATNIQVRLDSTQSRQVLAAKTATGQIKPFENLDMDKAVLPHPEAGARELGKAKLTFVKLGLSALKAPGAIIKKAIPLGIELGVAGLAGFGAWELTKMVVLAIAPHAAHAVVLGVSLAAISLLAATVIGYWAYRMYKPASGKLKAGLQDHENFKSLAEQNEAAAKTPAVPILQTNGKTNTRYNVDASYPQPLGQEKAQTAYARFGENFSDEENFSPNNAGFGSA